MNYGKSKKNKTKILFIAAALALVVTTAVFLVCFTGDNKGYRTISVVDIAGTVSVVKDGIEYSAYPGMILQEGHEIVTAANSYVRLVLDDDKYVKLESGSRLVFETLGLLGSNKTQMNLERGALTSEIVKPLESDAQYVVVAPNAVLSVRGTFFRVDLGVAENGEITADVMTYGGQVASQRIMPTGEVIEEEVLIDAGFKTSINMDTDDTVYVMQAVGGAVDTTGDGIANLAPIVVTDIPDDDMVDIYFAAENGHELFVSAEEAKVDIEDRGIDLEAQTSVYELAETIKEEAEETSAVTLAGAEVFADDSKPIARVEETEEESEVTGEVSSEKPTTTVVSVLTDGDGLAKEEVHVHTYTKAETLAATCEATGVNTYTCACGENYTEEIPAIGHTSVNGGTASAHVKCDSCGEILNGSTAHLYVQEVTTEPTCTTTGIRTYSCSCGHVYTEEIAALGHSEVAGNASDCHSQCFVCKEILVDGSGHVYSGSVTTAATCTTAGVRTFTCSCGHSYTESIAANGHSATTGGTESCHSKCSVCQATISDGSAHTFTITETDATCTQAGKTTYSCACGYSYTKEGEVLAHTYTSEITTEATCTVAGVKTFTCACGDSYTEEIPATGHSETTGGTENCHSKCSVCQVTITDGSAHTFTTSTTEATCTTAGATTYTCDCGYSYVKETEAMGHTEVNGGTADCHSKCDVCGEVISSTHKYTDTREEASCTEAGLITHACACGYSYTEDIVATGHTEVEGATETCHSKCDVCGEVISSTHKYTDTREEANCTEAGLITHACDCGYSYTEDIVATGHTEVAGATETCHSKCGVCQATIEDGSGHEFTSEITTVASCTAAGVETYSCACGYSYTKEIEATGHTEVAGATADCHSKCDVCDAVISTTHSYGEPEVTGATCTADGKEVYSCGCGYTYKEIIPSTGHTEVAGSTADCHSKCDVCGEVLSSTHTYTDTREEASCTEAGLITHTCDCGYVYTEEIAATGHTEVAGATEDCHSKCGVCQATIEDGSGHEFTSEVTTVATCTTAGVETYSCACGYSYTKEIEATGHTEVVGGTADCHSKCDVCDVVISTTHSYGDPEVTGATCTADGKEVYSCGCGYTYEEIIPSTGHTEVAGSTADCHSKCDVCDAVISTTHSYGDPEVTGATCTADGKEVYSCGCGYTYEEIIPSTGHTEVAGSTADCHSKCDVCDAVISATHSYGEPEVTGATCTADGKEVYSCECGYTYEEIIPSTGHTEVAGATADCHSKCEVCGEVLGSTHTYTDTREEATCTTAGLITHTCDCGYVYTEEIAATGHTEVAGATADCHSKCDVCGDVLDTTHTYTDTREEASCTEAGLITHVCECGYEYTEEIAATGHTEVAGATENCHSKCGVCQATIEDGTSHTYESEITTAATCTTTGVETYSCACGYSYTKEIEATGHTEVAGATADCHSKCEVCGEVLGSTHTYTDTREEASCTEAGLITHTCDCGYVYTEEIEATGHTEVAGATADCHSKCDVCQATIEDGSGHELTSEITIAATCTTTGVETYSCACGYSYTKEIEETGHTKTDASASVTTCSSCGEALVDLSATNFPDAIFLAYVEQFDTNGDSMLLGSELAAVTEIDVAGAGITDLTGIEHFTEITSLKCSSNSNLTSVDVSALTKLETLNLTSCSSLSTLDLTALTELVTLEVNGTALTSLDTRNNTKLEVLRANNATGISTFCGETGTLNFSYNTSLKEIQFNSNTNFTEIDLTQNAALEKFIYNMMPMTTIDLTGCTSLSNFQIVSSGVTALDFSSCTNLTTMVATTCTELTSLNVSKCPLTSLNIDRSTAISTLNVSGTKIASLDLSGRTALTTLTASSCTSLTSLNVSGCTLLKTINLASCTALSMDNVDLTGCSSLNSLNVDKCTKMTSLDFSMYDDLTALTSLTISNNSNLKTVDFSTLTALSSVSLANSGNMTNINISNTKLTGFDSSGMWSVVAFRAQNATKLTSISLGNASTLTTLDVTGCTALTSIDLNASSSLYSDTSQITGYTSSMGAIK